MSKIKKIKAAMIAAGLQSHRIELAIDLITRNENVRALNVNDAMLEGKRRAFIQGIRAFILLNEPFQINFAHETEQQISKIKQLFIDEYDYDIEPHIKQKEEGFKGLDVKFL